jgi:hypothetical protein
MMNKRKKIGVFVVLRSMIVFYRVKKNDLSGWIKTRIKDIEDSITRKSKIGGGFIPDLEEYERENQITCLQMANNHFTNSDGLEFIFNQLRRNKK